MRKGNVLTRNLKWAGLLVITVAVLAVLAFSLLYATAPAPRSVDRWSLGPPLPAERGELATAVAHATPCPAPPCPEAERLYVLGGLSGLGRVLTTVSSYDPTTRQWREEPPLPAPRHHPGAAGLGQAIYFTGGAADTDHWRPAANFWRLRVDATSWEALPPMPEGRFGHRLVAHDGRLYVVGGVGRTSRVLIYTPGEGWTSGATMPVPRDHLSAVVVGGRIWAIGGRSPQSLARVDIYDPATNTWSRGPDLPAPTSGAAEAALGDVIYVYGGEEPSLVDGQVYDRHWLLDTAAETPTWRPAPNPPLAVHGADGAVFQGAMYIAGGASRHGLLSVTAWTNAVQILARPPR